MTAKEIIENKRYHTCENCKYRDILYKDYPCNECYCICNECEQDDAYPCSECEYGADNREDHWEYRAESEE